MKTLVVVDVQNDFLPNGALAVPRGDAVVPVINSIIDRFDLVVATQDWHPQSHLSFASNHPGRQPFDKIVLEGLEQVLWPDHCVQGSGGADFVADLNARRIEAIFRKGMDPRIDSYSGFFDNGHRKATGMAGYLRARGAVQLYFCGLAADICVYYTFMDALREGFGAWLLEDASQPLHEGEFAKIKHEMPEAIISSKQL
jgi:nicotinamidase/pyrazinamidase